MCSTELKRLTTNDEKSWKRTDWPVSEIDSFFAHDFRIAVCSWRVGCRGEWLAIIENFVFGGRLHDLCADGSDAFQPAG